MNKEKLLKKFEEEFEDIHAYDFSDIYEWLSKVLDQFVQPDMVKLDERKIYEVIRDTVTIGYMMDKIMAEAIAKAIIDHQSELLEGE